MATETRTTKMFRTFVVADGESGGPRLYVSDQILSTNDPLADLDTQVDWEGHHWGGKVIVVGVGLDDGSWATKGRRD